MFTIQKISINITFYEFMKRIGTPERYQNNNLKAIITYSKFVEPSVSFYQRISL